MTSLLKLQHLLRAVWLGRCARRPMSTCLPSPGSQFCDDCITRSAHKVKLLQMRWRSSTRLVVSVRWQLPSWRRRQPIVLKYTALKRLAWCAMAGALLARIVGLVVLLAACLPSAAAINDVHRRVHMRALILATANADDASVMAVKNALTAMGQPLKVVNVLTDLPASGSLELVRSSSSRPLVPAARTHHNVCVCVFCMCVCLCVCMV